MEMADKNDINISDKTDINVDGGGAIDTALDAAIDSAMDATMDAAMDGPLRELRRRIDVIDDGLVNLFRQRMDVSAQIARHKRRRGLPVHDPAREREKLRGLSRKAGEGREAHVAALYTLLFELSRADQERIIGSGGGSGGDGGGIGGADSADAASASQGGTAP